MEVRVYKVDAIQWTALDAAHKPNAPPSESQFRWDEKSSGICLLGVMNRTPAAQACPPSYPSSSKKAKDWNKLEVEIKNEEKEEKPEGDAALNQ